MSKKQKRRLAREALAATRPEPPKREIRADLENDASLTEPAKKGELDCYASSIVGDSGS